MELKLPMPGMADAAPIKLFHWSQVQVQMQRAEAPPAGLTPTHQANVLSQEVTFDVTERIPYAAWTGTKWVTAMVAPTRVQQTTPVPFVRTDDAAYLAARGVEAGAPGSAYPLRPGA